MKLQVLTLTTILGICLSCFGQDLSNSVKCPLIWVDVNTGMSAKDLPSTRIPNEGNTFFVGRVVTEDGDKFVGQIKLTKEDNSDSNAGVEFWAAISRYDAKEHIYFQILTNPYRCTLSWESQWQYNKVKEFGNHDGSVVGRDHRYHRVGWIDERLGGELLVALEGGRVEFSRRYTVLISHLPGLQVKVSNMILDESPLDASGKIDLMGEDEIINDADVELVFTVTHTKLVSLQIFDYFTPLYCV